MTFTVQQMLAIQNRYDKRFGNLDEVFHDSICADARFNTLLQRALEAGAPLTREKVEAVFGPVRWDDNAGWKHTGGNEAKNVG